ncbi:MAG: hypothetical protein ACI33P_14785 [Lysinibacillus sp.]
MPELDIDTAYFTFILPFNFKQLKREGLIAELEKNGFALFDIENEQMQKQYYPDDIKISHKELGQFFYPFIEDKLFPKRTSEHGFFRFSKVIETEGQLQTPVTSTGFDIHSMDVWLCPANIGMIATRVKLQGDMEISEAINFAHYFRVLEPQLDEEMGATIEVEGKRYDTFFSLVKEALLPFIEPYLVEYKEVLQYGGSVPFFEDERMYTTGMLVTKRGEVDDTHLFRLGQMDGYSKSGHPFISAANEQYIRRYIEEHVLDRWAPYAYTVTSNQAHMHITGAPQAEKLKSIGKFFSTHYYMIIIYYFYKIILLKISFEHSEIEWKHDKAVVDELIEEITQFSAQYYFDEVAVRSEGRELSAMLRKQFRITQQYSEIKETLNELYRVLEDQADKRLNDLLFIMTIFTVISGIYGMNLVIEEWEGDIDWSKMKDYSIFEWICWVVALFGIGMSFFLVGNLAYRTISQKIKKRRRKKEL